MLNSDASRMMYFTVFTLALCACFISIHYVMVSTQGLPCEGPSCSKFLSERANFVTQPSKRTLRLPADALPVMKPPSAGAHKKAKHKLIFSATTGHSGTVWLSQLVACTLQKVRAQHEAEPSVLYFDRVLTEGLDATYQLRRDLKIPAFLRTLASLKPGETYADIDHMFVKSWGDIVMDWLEENDPAGEQYEVFVIVLRRDLPSVLASLLTLERPWQHLDGYVGGSYTIHDNKFAILPPLVSYEAETPVDRAIGYIIDIELQTQKFMSKYPRPTYVEVFAEDIFQQAGARALLNQLGLAPIDGSCLARLFSTGGKNSHISDEPEFVEQRKATLQAYKRQASEFRERHVAAGHFVPALPHLSA